MQDIYRSVSLAVLIAAVIWSASGARSARAQQQDSFVPNEVVIKLNNAADLAAVAADNGLALAPLGQFGSRAIFLLAIADGSAPPDKAAALANDGRVQYAEPNYIGQTPEGRQKYSWSSGGNGDVYAGQWAGAKMRLPSAHTQTRGRGVTVAVLDTGVDAAHPQLAGRTMGGFDFVDFDDDPSEVGVAGQDLAFGHGTHVAGLVALAAPDATIMPVRVLDPAGVGNMWVLAEGLRYAVDPDANPLTRNGALVINMSLGTTRQTNLLAEIIAGVTCADMEEDDGNEDDEVSEECEATGRRGAVVVAAAGNSGSRSPEYPAAEGVPGSLSVGASTRTDTIAPFSNRGAWVNVLAPGANIISSVPNGGYGVWSGTSMAAPLTAGTAALVRAQRPNWTALNITRWIVYTSQRIGWPVPYRVDAANAVGGG